MNPNEWEEVSVNNAHKLDIQAAKAKLKEKEIIKPPKAPILKPAAKSNALTKAQLSELHRMEQAAQEKQESTIKAALFAKWEMYMKRFPDHVPSNARSITPNSPIETIQGGIKAIQSSITADSSHEAAKLLVENLCGLFEYMTMDQDINPLGLNVRGLKKAVKWEINQPDSHFEPEVTEMSIELSSWLSGPWYARLARKMGESAIQMNTHNREKLGDLGNQDFGSFVSEPKQHQ